MIYIDTSAIIARHILKDQNHRKAVSYWAELSESSTRLYTSNFVLDEAVTLLTRWVGEKEAVNTALIFYASEAVAILRPEEEDEVKALDLLRKSSGRLFSYTDCISFALMNKMKIKKAFTFDSDFLKAGFQIIPG